MARALAVVGAGPVFLSVDWAVRTIAAGCELCGMDVVEVAPAAVASADITALVAERIVREAITRLAVARA